MINIIFFASKTNAEPSWSNDLTLADFVCLSDRQNSIIGTLFPPGLLHGLPLPSLSFCGLLPISFYIFTKSTRAETKAGRALRRRPLWVETLGMASFRIPFPALIQRKAKRDNHPEDVLHGQSDAPHTVGSTRGKTRVQINWFAS